MRSIFRKKILSAILFAFAVIAFMEIWARIDDFIRYDAPLLANYSQESMLVLEDSIGIRGKPNGRFEKWRLNNLGFRGANITQEKLPQVLRIVTLGASETFGIYESQDMEWPRQLEASLAKNFPDKKIEVVNVSFPGLGMESIRHYYETHVRPIDPDFVLLYSNFLAYLEKPKPALDTLAKSNQANLVLTSHSTPSKRSREINAFFHLLKPRLLSKLNQALHSRGPIKLIAYLETSQDQRKYHSFNRDGQNQHLDSTQARNFKHRLDEFIGVLKKDSITLVLSEHVHALTVWAAASHPRGWINLWKSRPLISETAFHEGYPVLNEIIHEAGVAGSIPVIGQNNLLAEADSNFANDGIHFTNRGAGKIAENFFIVLKPILENHFATGNQGLVHP